MIEDSGLLHEFVLEAKAHIAEIEAGLLEMEQGIIHDETVNEVFRAAHSIKGTAGFFELNKIIELAHSLENVFGELREHRLVSSPKMIDALLAAVDLLKAMLNSPEDSDTCDCTKELAVLKELITGNNRRDSHHGTKMLSAWDVWNELTNIEVKTAENTVEKVVPAAVSKVFEAQKVTTEREPKRVFAEDSVRVNVGLLNDLLTLAGELVLRRNQLLRITETAGKEVAQLEAVAKSMDELTTNLQKKVMQTRMLPIANVFNKFPRIVRDLSHKVNKEVELRLEGLDVGLDRSLIEALGDPLTHLVRNALDHGLEAPEDREKKNKPITGVLALRAFQESGRVIVDISDDGAGIDVEKVKQSALEKKLVTEKELANFRQADILKLIMLPGFSTADKVTDLSGRGVGMDVVKSNIESLGGKIELSSAKGEGTTFRLLLPLTLAIISAVIVIQNGQSFAIALTNIKELLLVQPDENGGPRVEEVHNQPVLRLRGKVLPLISLGDILEGASAEDKTLFADFTYQRQTLRVVIVKAGSKEYGLVVDTVYDTEEILVKPNDNVVKSCGLYSGVTVLGDGSIAMILDIESSQITKRLAFFELPSLPPKRMDNNASVEKQYLLLFKGSGSEVLGLDLAMISRVEEIAISSLKKIGTKYYFVFAGRTTRVIRPEYYLPLTRKKNKLTKVYVILPKFLKYPVGILVEEVYDAVYTAVALEPNGVTGRGILGSAIINNQVVTLLNMHELFAEAIPEYLAFSQNSNILSGKAVNNKVTLLLVEDTPFFIKVVKNFLECAGYTVILAENGREALELLRQEAVDIVVSDIEMPIMTGIELVRAIRADERLKELPVIALTSLRGESNKEKGLRAGFTMYEYKLDRIRLLESIKAVLKGQEKLNEVTR